MNIYSLAGLLFPGVNLKKKRFIGFLFGLAQGEYFPLKVSFVLILLVIQIL